MSLEDVGYFVLGPIARGGMAEVVLAERIGPGGVRKRFAIKRLLPDLASDPDFVTILENEARVAVELDHANVVSVFELGEASGELFLAMEYIRGWDLSAVLDASARTGTPIPVLIAVYIAHEACVGLAYAHEKRDGRGAPLGIVHRDVSPSNVLVSEDGAVKLADFGIAKAAAASTSTPAAWRNGKVPYMSPEQLETNALDARSDLYSLGVVLFEMLACRRLFPTDIERAASARQQPIPRLAELRPEAAELQTLVDRALSPDRESRFPSARAMAAALTDALRSQSHAGARGGLALREFLVHLGLPSPVSAENVADGERTQPVSLGRVPIIGGERPEATRTDVEPAPAPAARPHWRLIAALTALASLVAFGAGVIATRLHLARVATTLEVRTASSGASVWIDGKPSGTTPVIVRGLPRRVTLVRIGFTPDRIAERTVDFSESADQVLDLDLSRPTGAGDVRPK